MAEATQQAQQDFWRAPVPGSRAGVSPALGATERSSACHCGTEYIVSSLYCHACGTSRPERNVGNALRVPGLTELGSLAERLGLTTPAVIAFLAGMLCLLGALTVSFFFTARTFADWQAIQMWRVEWLLAAIAAFAAGCLLKK